MTKQNRQDKQPTMPKPARGGRNVGGGSTRGREGNGAQKLQQKKT
jgi:hypothetical protein